LILRKKLVQTIFQKLYPFITQLSCYDEYGLMKARSIEIDMKIRNIFGSRFSGTIGKEIIASSWRGKEYIKAYAKPNDPKSELQLSHRAIVAEAVKTWKKLNNIQKEFYERMSDHLPGYHFFVRLYVKTIRAEKEFRIPICIKWSRKDDGIMDGIPLIVQWQDKELFIENLGKREGEIALGPDHTPYTFLIRKGIEEETLLVLNELGNDSISQTLRSSLLGIEIAMVAAPNSDESKIERSLGLV